MKAFYYSCYEWYIEIVHYNTLVVSFLSDILAPERLFKHIGLQ